LGPNADPGSSCVYGTNGSCARIARGHRAPSHRGSFRDSAHCRVRAGHGQVRRGGGSGAARRTARPR
jgi:hypothetical protein